MLISGQSYTPQAPTSLSNGTTIIEAQVETIVDMVAKLEKENAKSIEPRKEAVEEWKEVTSPKCNFFLETQADFYFALL